MPLLILLILSLTGCVSQVAVLEKDLNAYALSAALGADLSPHLVGAALTSARQSVELMENFGITSYGSAEFSETSMISDNLFVSCLDVSGTQFRNVLGEPVMLERIDRQLVEIQLEGGRISALTPSGASC